MIKTNGSASPRSAAQTSSFNLVIVIPAHNEARFIGSVVLSVRRYAQHVVVIDDGSTDATSQIAEAAGAIVVRQPSNQGKGAALNAGFRSARELRADITITMDADGQHVSEEVQLITAPIVEGRADIVVGSRYLVPRSRVPLHRILGHTAFNFLTRHTSGVRATDSQSGFRAFSAEALQMLSFYSRGFSVESEMQFLARDYRLRLIEIPITILYTDKPKRSVISHGLLVLNGILRLVGQYRPLLFFGLPGLALFFLGLVCGGIVVHIYQIGHALAIGYALICVLLVVLGVFACLAD